MTCPTSATVDYTAVDQLVTGEAVALELPPASLGVRAGLRPHRRDDRGRPAGRRASCSARCSPSTTPPPAWSASLLVARRPGARPGDPGDADLGPHGRQAGAWACGPSATTPVRSPSTTRSSASWSAVVEIWVFSGVPALISALVSSKGKRLGDYVAGTYVVRDRLPLRLPVAGPDAAVPRRSWAAHADIAPLPGLPGGRAAAAARPRRHAQPAGPRHGWSPTSSPRSGPLRLAATAPGHPPGGLPRRGRRRAPSPRRAPALARGRAALAADPAGRPAHVSRVPQICARLPGRPARLSAELLRAGSASGVADAGEAHHDAASRHSPPAVIQAKK